MLIWDFSVYRCLDSAKISYCELFRICESVKLILMRFPIASLYFIVAFLRACSACTIIIRASVSFSWFYIAPYLWEVAVFSLGYDSACIIVLSDSRRPVRSFGQPSYLPDYHRTFPLPQLWGSVSMHYWALPPLVLGQLKLQKTLHLPQFSQISQQLGLGETIFASFFIHFLQCLWVRFSYGHHTGLQWELAVCGWRSWCTLGVDAWSHFYI